MSKLIAALAIALLTSGCATCREYPTTCAVITWAAVSAVALSIKHSNRGTVGEDGRIGPPLTPNCNVYPEMCK